MPAETISNRPNILFITTDQQRADCYGFQRRKVKTPHLDKMAASGTRFDNCITANPVCQPSRASILTGLLPLTHGVVDNGIDLPPATGEAGFSGQLAKNGYRTGFIGKAHFSSKNTFEATNTPENRIGSAKYGADWYGPYMGFEYVELAAMGQWARPSKVGKTPLHGERSPYLRHFERWFFDEVAGEKGFEMWAENIGPDVKGAARTWYSGLPVAWHSSTWVGNRAIEFLRKHAGGRPFCAWVSFPDPHHPFACPEPWSRLYHPDEVDLPAHRVRDLGQRPWWHRASLEADSTVDNLVWKEYRDKETRPPQQTDEQLRHMTVNYYGMISLVDHNVGRILAALHDMGLEENTLIFFTSDHGDYLGDHGLYMKGPAIYEGLLQVGLIVQGRGIPVGKVIHEPVSTLDIAATIYDYAGVVVPGTLQSNSLRPLIDNDDVTRDVAYCEWNLSKIRQGVELNLRAVRTKTQKLTLEEVSGAGEMYDLVNDPDEMRNVFDDPAHAKQRQELEEMIRARPGEVAEQLGEVIGMS